MSQRHSGYARKDLDLYETPAWATQALLIRVELPLLVWEPACGHGKIVSVLKRLGHIVFASDVVDRGSPHQDDTLDFLAASACPWSERCAICTNPPFHKAAEAFVRHALNLTRRGAGMVCVLLPCDFDHAMTRSDMFRQRSFAGKVVLTSRVRWIENSIGSPSSNHAWFFWDHTNQSEPVIRYANRREAEIDADDEG